jgi:hypothetical protein
MRALKYFLMKREDSRYIFSVTSTITFDPVSATGAGKQREISKIICGGENAKRRLSWTLWEWEHVVVIGVRVDKHNTYNVSCFDFTDNVKF